MRGRPGCWTPPGHRGSWRPGPAPMRRGADRPGAQATPTEFRPRRQVEDTAMRAIRHGEQAGGIRAVLAQHEPGAAGSEQFRVAQLLRTAGRGLVFGGGDQRHPGLGRAGLVAHRPVGGGDGGERAGMDDGVVLIQDIAARQQRLGQAGRIERGRAEAARQAEPVVGGLYPADAGGQARVGRRVQRAAGVRPAGAGKVGLQHEGAIPGMAQRRQGGKAGAFERGDIGHGAGRMPCRRCRVIPPRLPGAARRRGRSPRTGSPAPG